MDKNILLYPGMYDGMKLDTMVYEAEKLTMEAYTVRLDEISVGGRRQ